MSSKHLRGDVNYAWPQAEIVIWVPKEGQKLFSGGKLVIQIKLNKKLMNTGKVANLLLQVVEAL